jgi:hypothetical protein
MMGRYKAELVRAKSTDGTTAEALQAYLNNIHYSQKLHTILPWSLGDGWIVIIDTAPG